MKIIYKSFIILYALAIRFSSIWNSKALAWVQGRKNWYDKISAELKKEEARIWIHCASSGEFEQAKPLIDEIKNKFPSYKILISFFSPSGYSAAKNYSFADYIYYLPIDTQKNARKFIGLVNPKVVFFIKYEYWYYYLTELRNQMIPAFLISAIFRKDQIFFKSCAKFYKNILFSFTNIFVQDEFSYQLLKEHEINNVSIAGDTRFDRVLKISHQVTNLELIKKFINDQKTLVAGSTWPEDEKILSKILNTLPLKIIIAPHEINEDHLKNIEKLFPGAVRFSQLAKFNDTSSTLIIDNFGMLSKLYNYATIAYIGGGFTKTGIHNALEAAVYYKPLVFGPRYLKYKEAVDLVHIKAAYSFDNSKQCKVLLNNFITDQQLLKKTGEIAGNYISNNIGATEKIINYIQEKRLLTS